MNIGYFSHLMADYRIAGAEIRCNPTRDGLLPRMRDGPISSIANKNRFRQPHLRKSVLTLLCTWATTGTPEFTPNGSGILPARAIGMPNERLKRRNFAEENNFRKFARKR
jgi:hypothetical protein